MDFHELQARVLQHARDYSAKYGVAIDADFALLKLCEEVGELAQAVLIARGRARPDKCRSPQEAKTAIAYELADIVGMAIVAADLLGIDLEQAMSLKWLQKDV
jgi:NTP pyrophosphatase (non-canonical NTP hydrolase)